MLRIGAAEAGHSGADCRQHDSSPYNLIAQAAKGELGHQTV
jgi:hypothetical protein